PVLRADTTRADRVLRAAGRESGRRADCQRTAWPRSAKRGVASNCHSDFRNPMPQSQCSIARSGAPVSASAHSKFEGAKFECAARIVARNPQLVSAVARIVDRKSRVPVIVAFASLLAQTKKRWGERMTKSDIAEYIRDMTSELARMSREHGEPALDFLLQ